MCELATFLAMFALLHFFEANIPCKAKKKKKQKDPQVSNRDLAHSTGWESFSSEAYAYFDKTT